MIKRISRFAGAAALLLVAASCESPTIARPTASARNLSAIPHFDLSHATGLSSGQIYQTSFTLTSNGGTFWIGRFAVLNFPANSVCDPTTSTYGAGHWNDPCTTLAPGQSITETVTVGIVNGGLTTDFSTPIRFSPNTVVTESSWLMAGYILSHESYLAANHLGLEINFDFSPYFGAAGVNDALTDPDVVPHIDWSTGRVWRRIKHFSGYNILTGEPCDPSLGDPNCVDDGSGTGQ